MRCRLLVTGVAIVAALGVNCGTLALASPAIHTSSHPRLAQVSTPACGDVLFPTATNGSWTIPGGGVDVYSNGATDEGTDSDCSMQTSSVNGVTAGDEWQCVEFVNRLYLTRGWITGPQGGKRPAWPGSAGPTFYNDAPSNLTKQLNGLVTHLGPGDVVIIDVFRNGVPDGGHALVVNDTSDVSSGTVDLVSQNGGYEIISESVVSGKISGGFVTVGGGGNGWTYTTVGVVHAPARTPPPTGTIGTQLAGLRSPDTAKGGQDFGYSVAISGSTAIVGDNHYGYSSGRAYIFANTSEGWMQTAELKNPTSAFYNFGWSVAIAGSTAVVGAPSSGSNSQGPGRAYVFAKAGSGWKQVGELKGASAEDNEFGLSVAISGTTIVVGSCHCFSNDIGRAYVFTKTPSGWRQVADLGDPAPGLVRFFGSAVAVSGSAIFVNGASTNGPLMYVFDEQAGRWHQVVVLKGSDTTDGDNFGSISVSGTTAIGIEIEERYCEIAVERLAQGVLPLSSPSRELDRK